jgi:DNA-binding transcriptional LysR family regulator
MDVDFNDLQALLALSDTLHFGRAARRLHVSQPALSKRLRRMEERIGGPLLVRGYRDVRLTEAGRLLPVAADTWWGKPRRLSLSRNEPPEAKPDSCASDLA